MQLELNFSKCRYTCEHSCKSMEASNSTFCCLAYFVLQITAVLVWLPDLLLQLSAALVLIGQPLGQHLVPLPGFSQLLQGGRWFHLHSLGDKLAQVLGVRISRCVSTTSETILWWFTLTAGSLPLSLSSSSCSSFTLSSRFLSSSPLRHSLRSLLRSSCESCSARCCREASSCCTRLRRFSFSWRVEQVI